MSRMSPVDVSTRTRLLRAKEMRHIARNAVSNAGETLLDFFEVKQPFIPARTPRAPEIALKINK